MLSEDVLYGIVISLKVFLIRLLRFEKGTQCYACVKILIVEDNFLWFIPVGTACGAERHRKL